MQEAPNSAEAERQKEEELRAKIQELTSKTSELETEIKILEGRQKNQDQKLVAEFKKENEELQTREKKLIKAWFALSSDLIKPREPEGRKVYIDSLKNATIEYSKKSGIKEEIWKKLESSS